jgi:hypothetical protein
MSFKYARVDDADDSIILEKEVEFTASSSREAELLALLQSERRDMDHLDTILGEGVKDRNTLLIEDWEPISIGEIEEEGEPKIDELRESLETAFNPDMDKDQRIKAIHSIFERDSDNGNMTLSVINHTLSTFSGRHIFDTILESIKGSSYSFETTYRLIHMLYLAYPGRRQDVLNYIENMLSSEDIRSIATPIRASLIKSLISSDTHQDKGLSHARLLVLSQDIHIEYRMRFILDLHTIHTPNTPPYIMDKDVYASWSKEVLLEFIRDHNLSSKHRNIVGSILLNTYNLSENEISDIYTLLFEIGTSRYEDYNTKADALDILVSSARRMGHRDVYERANRELHALGVTRTGKTIYDNAQNVHQKSITDNAMKVLSHLEKRIEDKGIKVDPFDKVRDEFMATIWAQKPTKPDSKDKDSEEYKLYRQKKRDYKTKVDGISYSLTRISLDYTLYGITDRTLMDIMCILWAYMRDHPSREELVKRMEEELFDASGLCSTGHAFRLLNIISGYDDIGITISIEDDFMVKVQMHLNRYVSSLPDSRLESVVLEMGDTSKSLLDRSNYRQFISDALSAIQPDLWLEYQDQLDATDFGLYMRKAIMRYENEDF